MLRIAEFMALEKQGKPFPILLLDDTFAELDDNVKSYLLEHLQDKTQICYASVLETDKHLFRDRQLFHIQKGRLSSA